MLHNDSSTLFQNGTLQHECCYKTVRGTKRYITKRYVVQNGTWYKTVRGTKRYVVQNGTWYKTVRGIKRYITKPYITKRYGYKTVWLQNGNCYKMVIVTKQ